MCSRFHLSMYAKRILEDFPGYRDFKEGDFRPGDLSPVFLGEYDKLYLSYMKWGFHPDGRKDNIFNARSESVEERSMFQKSFQEQRCIIPASWFYEWNRKKEKVRFDKKEDGILYLAGLWRREEDGSHFVVLTTEANSSMKPVHDRMPLLLGKEDLTGWIQSPEPARELLKKTPEELVRSSDYEQLSLFDF